MAAQPLTFAELKAEVSNRLDGSISSAVVNRVLGAFVEEVTDCVVTGYKVSIPGLLSIEPVVKAGRKKGSIVRNPFDGTERKLRTDEPDKFQVKVKKSSALVKKFPTLRTSDGRNLYADLSRGK